MARLKLYRRHTKGCIKGYRQSFRVFCPDSKTDRASDCECPIHAEGTLRVEGLITNRSTRSNSWSNAKTIAAQWERWGQTKPPAHAAELLSASHGQTGRNITKRQRAEAQLAQMNRLYSTRSQVNRAIVRASQPVELYRSICDVAVESGGFSLAWVGLLDQASGDVRPVAASGVDLDPWPFETVNIHHGVFKDGLSATAIRRHTVVVSDDVEIDERVRGALGQIQGRGLHSAAAIPIRRGGETIGILALVSPQAGLFKEASEVSLLQEIGSDLSFALDAMAAEAQRKCADEALTESERRYGELFRTNPVAMHLAEVICDAEGRPIDYRFLYVNPAFEHFAHCKAADIVGRTVLEFAPSADRAAVERQGRVALTGVADRFEGFSAEFNSHWEATVYSPRQGQCLTFLVDITERKQAEKALQESEEKFRTLVNFVPQMVWMCTPDGLNIYFNQRWVDYTGMSLEDSYGRGWNIPFHDDDKPAAWKAWNHAVATGETYVVESRLRAADGSYRWFLMQGKPMRDATGGIYRWFGTCTDIEDMKQAEAELREREYLLTASQRVAHVGTWSSKLGVGNPEVKWSDENYRLYGMSPDQGAPDPESFFEMVHPEDRQELREWHQAVVAGLHPPSLEFRALLPDGSVRVIRTTGDVIETVDGVPSRIAGTAYDVTERKQAEEALRKSEAKFRAAFSALVEGIVIMDNEARVTDANTSLEELVGYRRESLADPSGEPRPGIIREDGSPFPVNELPARVALRTGEAVREVVMGIPKPDGGITWVEVNSQPMRDDAGNLHGVVSSLFDITGRKRADAEVRQLNAELEKRVRERTAQLESVNRELETFTYSVSHDLKAPLRGIDGYSRLLLQTCHDQLGEEGRQFGETIRGAAQQMTQLIDDLLAYSRMERRELNMTSVDLRAVVEQLAVPYAAEFAARNVDLSVTLPRFVVRVDREGIQIAIRNLLENALKFTRDTPSPAIHIGGRETPQSYTMWISDNGQGFDMKYHDRIFEIFQRLHRVEEYPGTGVGLALVRKAMGRLGGRVWAESAPGAGAKFYLELPK